MLLYNVHAPSKTFSIQHKDDESFSALVDRIATKSGLERNATKALKEGKEGGLVYEYEGKRYSLEDDDDFSILQSRYPPSSTPHVTLHLTPPSSDPSSKDSHHAHFAPAPPSYSNSSASNLKNKVQQKEQKEKTKTPSSPAKPNGDGNGNGHGLDSIMKSTSTETASSPLKTKDYAHQSLLGAAGSDPKSALGAVGNASTSNRSTSASARKASGMSNGTSGGGIDPEGKRTIGTTADGHHIGLVKASKHTAGKAQSVMSSKSRRSKWGDDDAEPLGVVNQRKWEDFHAHSGVRTVMGKVGNTPNVRMLLKSGYRHVYVSRTFAIKSGLVSSKFAMGASGYTGLKTLGNITITVGSKTASHPAMISEEQNFDVVLGRSWMEKMNVKTDPIDLTLLTYMDSGETIPCDIVVLKDSQGNKILIT